MPNVIDAIIRTRGTAADIFVKSLVNIDNLSEAGIAEKIKSEINRHPEIFPEGWYNPPPSGIAVLLDQKPFNRFLYESLRKSEFWPQKNLFLKKETVGLIYFSPIDRKTGMIGDIGLTLYKGADEKIKQHLKNSYKAILKIAEHAAVGMAFSQICNFAADLYQNEFKMTKWVPISSNPNVSINLGHSVPGSFENNLAFGNSYEEMRKTIRTNRVHINETEHFKIPETCAFTIESRLEDFNNPGLPSAYFHFIVCFSNGQKTILDNYRQIFSAVGMDYMNSK